MYSVFSAFWLAEAIVSFSAVAAAIAVTDLDFPSAVINIRQFADASGQARTKKKLCIIDSRTRSPSNVNVVQPE